VLILDEPGTDQCIAAAVVDGHALLPKGIQAPS
jgi:hypothetical protein